MASRKQVQYQKLEEPKEAYLGDYSGLAQQFLKRPTRPINSVGQGIAEVLGDVGEAYFMRKAAEKDQERDNRDLSAVALARQFASNPNTSRVNVNDALGQERTIANSVFDRPADPNERYAGAMAQIQDNPRAQIAAGPGVMDLAKQFAPKEKEYLAPVAGSDEKGNPIMVRPEKGGPGFAPMQGVAPPMPEILQPGVEDARARVSAAGRPVTNINTKGETKYVETRSEDYAKQASAYQSGGRNAAKKLGQLSVLNSALSDPSVYQGTAGPAVTGVKRGLKTLFGADVEGVGPAELASRVGGEMALALKENLPGPMSDGDRRFLLELPPGLTNSREGNMLLVEYHQRMARREMEVAELAREYESAVGRLDVGFDDVLADFAEQNPIFSEDDFKKAAGLAGSTAQPSPLAGTEQLLREADAIAAGSLGRQ